MSDYAKLLALSDDARLLHRYYESAVNEWRRDAENLQVARQCHEDGEPWPQTVESALHCYRARADLVTQFSDTLMEVAAAVPLLLPEIADELEYVLLARLRWHDDQNFPWRDAERELLRIENAARRAASQTPQLTPTESRNQYCYQQWQAGKAYKEIWVEVKRHSEWDQFGEHLAVRSAIRSWANRHGLPVRTGQPGKPSGLADA